MQITELVTGSLVDEVQRVTLRAEGPIDTGTFRLEVGGASSDGRWRGQVDADHDDRYWTSQLDANSTAEEARTTVLQCIAWVSRVFLPKLYVATCCAAWLVGIVAAGASHFGHQHR